MLFTGATLLSNFAATTETTRQGVSVAADATPHTKGAYVTLLASTGAKISYGINLLLRAVGQVTTDTSMLLDLAYGDETTGGNEVILVNNINAGAVHATNAGAKVFFFPVTIPANRSVRARLAAVIGSDTVLVGIKLVQDPLAARIALGAATVVTYGADAANSRGTLITSGTADYGAWVELGDTSADHNFWAIGLDQGADTTQATRNVGIQLGTGPNSGAVTAFPMEFSVPLSSSEEVGGAVPAIVMQAIASGSKLWARVASTDANDIPGIIVYGITLSTSLSGSPAVYGGVGVSRGAIR